MHHIIFLEVVLVKLCSIYIIYCILHVYISYIFKYKLNFVMFMNLTIHDKIHNINFSDTNFLVLKKKVFSIAISFHYKINSSNTIKELGTDTFHDISM